MARLKEFDIDPDNVDVNKYATSQTPTAGNALTLTSTLSNTFARRVGVTQAGDENARTFTVVGTDHQGYALTEGIGGLTSGVAESTEYFKTITSITPDAATAGAIQVGTVDELISTIVPIDWRSDQQATVNVDVTGTIDFTLEETFDDVQRPGEIPRSAYANSQWVSVATSGAADNQLNPTLGATAVRLKVNSYSDTAEIQMNVVHPTSRRT